MKCMYIYTTYFIHLAIHIEYKSVRNLKMRQYFIYSLAFL